MVPGSQPDTVTYSGRIMKRIVAGVLLVASLVVSGVSPVEAGKPVPVTVVGPLDWGTGHPTFAGYNALIAFDIAPSGDALANPAIGVRCTAGTVTVYDQTRAWEPFVPLVSGALFEMRWPIATPSGASCVATLTTNGRRVRVIDAVRFDVVCGWC